MSSSSSASLDGIIALFDKGERLFNRHNPIKSMETFARAAAQAEQLTGNKDNLISAYLTPLSWSSVLDQVCESSMSSADSAAFYDAMHAEMLAVVASLQRRWAANTLLRGTEHEVAFFDARVTPMSSVWYPPLSSGAEARPGFVAFVTSALSALQSAIIAFTGHGQKSALWSVAEARHLFDFIAEALDLIGQTVAPDGSPLLFVDPAGAAVQPHPCEMLLVRTVSQYERFYPLVRSSHPEVLPRFDEAWRRLSAGPVLRVRNFAVGVDVFTVAEKQMHASHVHDLQRRVLRRCQLPACGKKEVHPSQFKHCSGCSAAAAVYCCKEHQVADWPNHKVACKAARKEKDGEVQEGQGAGKKRSGGGGEHGAGGGGGGSDDAAALHRS